MPEARKLRIGLIGAGEVAQVIHLPTLALMSDLFTATIVCDISNTLASHCATKFHVAKHTTSPQDVWNSPDVDVVFILTADEYHETYTISSIQAGKLVMIEKPMTLSLPSAKRILDAEEAAGGNKVFVGYMRRYAPSFTEAFKREISTMPEILYARVRDFSGPNPSFVAQSGTFPIKPLPQDFTKESSEDRTNRATSLLQEAWSGQQVTPERNLMTRFLNTLGSHDISLMREVLGLPTSVAGVSANDPFYTAILNYEQPGGKSGKFSVTYETGIDKVPVFDAHCAVYGKNKRVMIEYPSPFVKGLPIKVTVDELNEQGETQFRQVLSSYEDTYTCEMRSLWAWAVEGKPIKTTAADAAHDLEIFDMIYQEYNKTARP